MGIAFHPIDQGEIDGENEGINSDLSVYKFAQGLAFDKFDSDYWLGFGAGYVKGQAIRNRLKIQEGPLSFEEKLACCQYLFSKRISCPINVQHYLDNIQNWDNLKIETSVYQTALKFLATHKIQRAIDEVFSFYKENFRLKALKAFELLAQDLKNIRKKKLAVSNYDTSKDKVKLEVDLYNWLNENRAEE